MSDIDICIQQLDKRYSRRVLKVQSFCKKIIRSAWFSYTPAEVSLVLADDDFVHDLNFSKINDTIELKDIKIKKLDNNLLISGKIKQY